MSDRTGERVENKQDSRWTGGKSMGWRSQEQWGQSTCKLGGTQDDGQMDVRTKFCVDTATIELPTTQLIQPKVRVTSTNPKQSRSENVEHGRNKTWQKPPHG